jgi:hypothetical protein
VALIGVMNVWNEAAIIADAVRSLHDCDRLIVLDGVYADYPGAAEMVSGASTDGTLDVVRSIRPDAHILEAAQGPQWLFEAHKRSRGFKGQVGDWYLILDADERANGVPALKVLIETIDSDKEAREHIGWIEVCIQRAKNNRMFTGHRVVRHVDAMHYQDSHHDLLDFNGQSIAPITGRAVTTPWRSAWIPQAQFWIQHCRELRTPERLEKQGQFYRERIGK